MNPGTLPEGYSAVSPYIVYEDVEKALAFYEKAFGWKARYKMPAPDGRIVHAEISHGGCTIMLGMPMGPHAMPKPVEGDPPMSLYVMVENVDEAFAKAVAAGCTVKRPLADQFYGDRTGCFADPFGHQWTFGQRVRNVSPEEMERAFADMMRQMAKP